MSTIILTTLMRENRVAALHVVLDTAVVLILYFLYFNEFEVEFEEVG